MKEDASAGWLAAKYGTVDTRANGRVQESLRSWGRLGTLDAGGWMRPHRVFFWRKWKVVSVLACLTYRYWSRPLPYNAACGVPHAAGCNE